MSRYSTTSSSSSESSSDSLASTTSSHRRRRPSLSRPIPAPESLYDPPVQRHDDASSTEGDSKEEEEDEAYERERERRKKRQDGREMRAAAGPASRAGREKEKQRKERTMRSLGLQGTQLKHILPGSSPDRKSSSKRSSSTSATPTVVQQTDLERQAADIKRRRRVCSTLSKARIAYITLIGIICLALVIVGIVVGVNAAKEKEEKDEALEEANPGSGLNALEAEAEHLESAVSAYVVDPSAEAGHGEATMTSSSAATTTRSIDASLPSTTGIFAQFPELQDLYSRNREFVNETEEEYPGLIEELAEGQHPQFAYLGCSDSRVSVTDLFDAKLGEIFVTRNIGNQYLVDDLSSETVMAYAIAHLGVQHIIVMGHTECGAVQAAIVSASSDISTDIGETRIETWIRPIRSIVSTSNRTEIADFRKEWQEKTIAAADVTDEVWRAVVEENVRMNVKRLAQDSPVTKVWKEYNTLHNSTSTAGAEKTDAAGHRKRSSSDEPVELWVHGWVYDVSTGLVSDLGVSVGPNGAYSGA
ncbi:hypothetical protein JCM8547_007645 [Rhodosporidiobolus lusitaniae]